MKEPNFDVIARRAGSAVLPLPRFDNPYHAFARLEDVNAGPDAVPAGLVFLDALAAEVGSDLGVAMREWIEEKIRELHIEEAFQERRRAMLSPADKPRLHLLIFLDHDGIDSERYVLSVWRQDDPNVWPPPKAEIRDAELDQMERVFDEVVVAAERAWADQHASVTLEVLLPRELLSLPVQRWSKEHESRTTPTTVPGLHHQTPFTRTNEVHPLAPCVARTLDLDAGRSIASANPLRQRQRGAR